MTGVAEPGGRGDVAEPPLAVVLEQYVAAAHGRHVEVRVAVIVDVGERGGDADLSRQRHARLGSDVLESAAAGIPPELVAADLVDEVDVRQPISIDIRYRQAVAMVVVRGLVRLARVVNDSMRERDAAVGAPIGELEIVER